MTEPVVHGRTSRWAARVARMMLISMTLLITGGLLSIIILGPAETRWLVDRGFRSAGAHRLWTTMPAGIPEGFLYALRHGVIASQEGRYQDAVTALTAAVSASTNAQTIETLGARAGNSTLPETHLWRLDIQVRIARADALEHLKRYNEALQDLDYAVRLNRQHYDNLQQRAVALMVVGRIDDALADFDALLMMRASGEVSFARGFARYLRQDWIGAVEDFERAASVRPQNRKYVAWLLEAQSRTTRGADGPFTPTSEDIWLVLRTGNGFPAPAQQAARPLSGK